MPSPEETRLNERDLPIGGELGLASVSMFREGLGMVLAADLMRILSIAMRRMPMEYGARW